MDPSPVSKNPNPKQQPSVGCIRDEDANDCVCMSSLSPETLDGTHRSHSSPSISVSSLGRERASSSSQWGPSKKQKMNDRLSRSNSSPLSASLDQFAVIDESHVVLENDMSPRPDMGGSLSSSDILHLAALTGVSLQSCDMDTMKALVSKMRKFIEHVPACTGTAKHALLLPLDKKQCAFQDIPTAKAGYRRSSAVSPVACGAASLGTVSASNSPMTCLGSESAIHFAPGGFVPDDDVDDDPCTSSVCIRSRRYTPFFWFLQKSITNMLALFIVKNFHSNFFPSFFSYFFMCTNSSCVVFFFNFFPYLYLPFILMISILFCSLPLP